ncbi:type II secretion system F family protein [Pseudonocardia phyllosphaerae]|uniref:type II secretion system F family protein n=1 Tax=Pseudonocardia phyllosphaerae TaxID=3390502 RepID=UPI00397E0DC1
MSAVVTVVGAVPGAVVSAVGVVAPDLVPPLGAPALVLLAAAVLAGGGRPAAIRLRGLTPAVPAPEPAGPRVAVLALLVPAGAALGWVVGGGTGTVLGALAGAGAAIALHRASAPRPRAAGAGDLAAAWDLLATCLTAGLTVPDAVSAAARRLPGSAGHALRRISGLLALGADPGQAWATASGDADLAGFARATGRSAGTGAALGRAARAEAARLRSELTDRAEEHAQRAAVRITAPLGLCFLPAFLVLGIVPVVIGLAGQVIARW